MSEARTAVADHWPRHKGKSMFQKKPRGYPWVAMTLAGALLAAPAYAKKAPGPLGPSNPGAESGFNGWYHGAVGGGSVYIQNDDPASGSSYFRIGVTNAAAYPTNHADFRSEHYALRHSRGPFTFSFAYKLPGQVKPGDNIDVHLRFFGADDHNFLGQTHFLLGSATADSQMPHYKTMTISNIFAPSGAVEANIWVVANNPNKPNKYKWTSGYAQFDNFSVTMTPSSSAEGSKPAPNVPAALSSPAPQPPSDAYIRVKIVGVWRPDSTHVTTVKADGSVVCTSEGEGRPTSVLAFKGTWQVANGYLLMTVTNIDNQGVDGEDLVESNKVVRIDDHEWVAQQEEGETNLTVLHRQ